MALPTDLCVATGLAVGQWVAQRAAAGAGSVRARWLGTELDKLADSVAESAARALPHLFVAPDGGGDGGHDVVLANLWTSAAVDEAALAASFASLRPGGCVVALVLDDPGAPSAVGDVREKLRAARAAGAPLPLPAASSGGARGGAASSSAAAASVAAGLPPDADAAGVVLRRAAAAAGAAVDVTRCVIDSQLDVSGLLDAPPPPRTLRALTSLLGVDAAALALAPQTAPQFRTVVRELLGASLFNVAPSKGGGSGGGGGGGGDDTEMTAASASRQAAARALAAGDAAAYSSSSAATSGVPVAARMYLHTPITAVIATVVSTASTASAGAGAGLRNSAGVARGSSAGKRPRSSGGVSSSVSTISAHSYSITASSSASAGGISMAMSTTTTTTTTTTQLEGGSPMLVEDGAGGLDEDLDGTPLPFAAALPPLRLLLSEPGLVEKHDDGSLSLLLAPAGARSTRLDAHFPHGADRGYFNFGLARWQEGRSAWKRPPLVPPPAPVSQQSSRQGDARAPASSTAAPAASSASDGRGSPSSDSSSEEYSPDGLFGPGSYDLQDLYELLASNEFTNVVELPRRVGLADLIGVYTEIWEDAGSGGVGGFAGSDTSEW